MRSQALLVAVVAVVAAFTVGCPPKTVPIPQPDPKVHPTATLDIVFPSGVRTVTATTIDPALVGELPGGVELSFSARCSDPVAGCRNIQIFVDGVSILADGTAVAIPGPKLRAENPDPNANGSANVERLVTAKLNVGSLRGTNALLRFEVSARATNGFGAVEDTRVVTLFWMNQAPVVMPSCARFSPIGFDPPFLVDAHSSIDGIVKAKNANPPKTEFVIGIVTPPGHPAATIRLTLEETALPPTQGEFRLVNNGSHDRSGLLFDGRNCNSTGMLLNAPGNSSSSSFVANSASTTSLVLTGENLDAVVWNEATFWLLFGGKRTTITWLQ